MINCHESEKKTYQECENIQGTKIQRDALRWHNTCIELNVEQMDLNAKHIKLNASQCIYINKKDIQWFLDFWCLVNLDCQRYDLLQTSHWNCFSDFPPGVDAQLRR